jgi:hypothetical protein
VQGKMFFMRVSLRQREVIEPTKVDSINSQVSDKRLANAEPPTEEFEASKRGKKSPSPEDRIKMIQEEHAIGHFGRDQIFHKIWSKGYWWKDIRKQIQKELMRCEECVKFVIARRGFNPSGFITAAGPMEMIQMDCQTNLPRSPEGFTTLFSIVDVFTGFCLLFPIPDHSAASVASKLWYAISILGFPKIIQSDNGTEFVNEVVKELTRIAAMDHRFIAAYNPRCDGKVERTFGVKNEVIKKLLQGADSFWPSYIPLVQLYLNSRMSSLTKTTPMALMFNRESNIPSHFPINPEDADPPFNGKSLEDWQSFQRMVINLIHPSISSRIMAQKKRMKEKLDATRRIILSGDFPVGSLVTLLDSQYINGKVRPKHAAPYTGKYTIIRKDRAKNLVLKDETGEVLSRHVPPDQVKLIDASPSVEATSNEENYVVDKVIAHRGLPGHFEYLVKWKGFSHEDNTWEPASNFITYDCIRDYWSFQDEIARKAMERSSNLS